MDTGCGDDVAVGIWGGNGEFREKRGVRSEELGAAALPIRVVKGHPGLWFLWGLAFEDLLVEGFVERDDAGGAEVLLRVAAGGPGHGFEAGWVG